MLQITVKPHRTYLRANAGPQKLFVMLKLLPSFEAARVRPRVNLAVVIDTSGSMREPAPGARTESTPPSPAAMDGNGRAAGAAHRGWNKLDVAMEAARRLLESDYLRPDDLVSIIQFDDRSQVMAAGRADQDREQLLDGISRLTRHSGGTRMGRGLGSAEGELRKEADTARKVLLLTDGRTVDEDECRRLAGALAELRAPIVAFGVGEEYNEDLLAELCNITQGKPYDLRDMATLPGILEAELGAATRQVVSDVQVTVKTVRDVRLASATRAYPNLADVDVRRDPLELGNLEAGDHTVFVLELDLPERPPLRARLAQIGVTYWVPAQRYRGEAPPVDLVVEFTDDEALAAAVDGEVMGYVQQRNVDHLIRQATELARKNPQQAAQTLQLARSMTQRLGNQAMTVALGKAEEELRANGTISAGTVKTIKVGARTQTMKVGGPDHSPQDIPSEDAIRRLTGA